MACDVRNADKSELAAIGDVLIEAYEDFAADLAGAWDQMCSSLQAAPRKVGARRWLVAGDDGLVDGVVAYYPPGQGDAELFEPNWASIRLLGVRPKARHRGIAKALTLACIERARADGARHIGLHTSELMIAAQALYESLGFHRTHEIDRRFGVRYWVYAHELGGVSTSPAV